MRLSSVVIGAVALLGLLLVVGALSGVVPSKVADVVATRDLEDDLARVGVADARLKQAIRGRLEGDREPEREIDLDNPTEEDFQFLREVFSRGERAARVSAAKVLVEIQEPRAVGMLARAGDEPGEQAFFCAAALDILRVQTRVGAAELMLEVLEDAGDPPSTVCRPLLEEKLEFISGRSYDLLPDLLGSDSARVRRYALEHLDAPPSPELVSAVENLAQHGTRQEAELAQAWLSNQRSRTPPVRGIQ